MTRTRRPLCALACLLSVGCGGSAYEYRSGQSPGAERAESTGGASYEGGDAVQAIAMEAQSGGGGGYWDDADFETDEAPASPAAVMAEPPAAPRPERVAQAGQPQSQPTGAGATQPADAPTDASVSTGPLLIYTADLHLAVYEVTETQDRIIGAVSELGGFLAERSDDHVVLRIPARRFEEAITAIEAAGDVIHRNVQALDVTEEFRDLEIRIRNAEAMRARLEALLVRAASVEDALAIERELQRITEHLESMKGRLRFLGDRISYSTITVRFQSRATDSTPSDEFRLPFGWLEQLGLRHLLTL